MAPLWLLGSAATAEMSRGVPSLVSPTRPNIFAPPSSSATDGDDGSSSDSGGGLVEKLLYDTKTRTVIGLGVGFLVLLLLCIVTLIVYRVYCLPLWELYAEVPSTHLGKGAHSSSSRKRRRVSATAAAADRRQQATGQGLGHGHSSRSPSGRGAVDRQTQPPPPLRMSSFPVSDTTIPTGGPEAAHKVGCGCDKEFEAEADAGPRRGTVAYGSPLGDEAARVSDAVDGSPATWRGRSCQNMSSTADAVGASKDKSGLRRRAPISVKDSFFSGSGTWSSPGTPRRRSVFDGAAGAGVSRGGGTDAASPSPEVVVRQQAVPLPPPPANGYADQQLDTTEMVRLGDDHPSPWTIPTGEDARPVGPEEDRLPSLYNSSSSSSVFLPSAQSSLYETEGSDATYSDDVGCDAEWSRAGSRADEATFTSQAAAPDGEDDDDDDLDDGYDQDTATWEGATPGSFPLLPLAAADPSFVRSQDRRAATGGAATKPRFKGGAPGKGDHVTRGSRANTRGAAKRLLSKRFVNLWQSTFRQLVGTTKHSTYNMSTIHALLAVPISLVLENPLIHEDLESNPLRYAKAILRRDLLRDLLPTLFERAADEKAGERSAQSLKTGDLALFDAEPSAKKGFPRTTATVDDGLLPSSLTGSPFVPEGLPAVVEVKHARAATMEGGAEPYMLDPAPGGPSRDLPQPPSRGVSPDDVRVEERGSGDNERRWGATGGSPLVTLKPMATLSFSEDGPAKASTPVEANSTGAAAAHELEVCRDSIYASAPFVPATAAPAGRTLQADAAVGRVAALTDPQAAPFDGDDTSGGSSRPVCVSSAVQRAEPSSLSVSAAPASAPSSMANRPTLRLPERQLPPSSQREGANADVSTLQRQGATVEGGAPTSPPTALGSDPAATMKSLSFATYGANATPPSKLRLPQTRRRSASAVSVDTISVAEVPVTAHSTGRRIVNPDDRYPKRPYPLAQPTLLSSPQPASALQAVRVALALAPHGQPSLASLGATGSHTTTALPADTALRNGWRTTHGATGRRSSGDRTPAASATNRRTQQQQQSPWSQQALTGGWDGYVRRARSATGAPTAGREASRDLTRQGASRSMTNRRRVSGADEGAERTSVPTRMDGVIPAGAAGPALHQPYPHENNHPPPED